MTVGIRIGNTHGGLLIDDRFHGIALKSTAAVAGDITVWDASGNTYIFGTPGVLGPGVGMRVFNSVDHTVAFDSRNKYIRVVDIFTGSLNSMPVSKTYPAGRTYACGLLGFSLVTTQLVANPSNFARTEPAQEDRPSPGFSGVTLTVTKDSQTGDDWPAPPLSQAGTKLINRPNWTVVVVDVTGY